MFYKYRNVTTYNDIVNNKKVYINDIRPYKNDTSPKIYIFYHIFCNEYTLHVLQDQINKIIWSGLYDVVDNIFCFLTGDEENIKICSNYIKDSGRKFSIEATGTDDKTYERFTLLQIKKYIKPSDKFLYIHTKGVTKENNKYVTGWRNVMEYFLIKNYKDCLNSLEEYDTVGINYSKVVDKHYSGNFWWTRGSYYLKLNEYIDNDYLSPELYITTANPKMLEIFSTGDIQLYNTYYPLSKYVDL